MNEYWDARWTPVEGTSQIEHAMWAFRSFSFLYHITKPSKIQSHFQNFQGCFENITETARCCSTELFSQPLSLIKTNGSATVRKTKIDSKPQRQHPQSFFKTWHLDFWQQPPSGGGNIGSQCQSQSRKKVLNGRSHVLWSNSDPRFAQVHFISHLSLLGKGKWKAQQGYT